MAEQRLIVLNPTEDYNLERRVALINSLKRRFTDKPGIEKTPVEMERLVKSLLVTLVNKKGIFQGVIVGGGYILTVGHGVMETETVYDRGRIVTTTYLHSAPVAILSKRHNGSKLSQLEQAKASNVSSHLNYDTALLYLPELAYNGPQMRFRLPESAKSGETVYLATRKIAQDKAQPLVQRAKVTQDCIPNYKITQEHLGEYAPRSGRVTAYSGQVGALVPAVGISATAEEGMSGSPVFDISGQLIGLVTAGFAKDSKPTQLNGTRSLIVDLGGSLNLLYDERQRLTELSQLSAGVVPSLVVEDGHLSLVHLHPML